MNNLSMKRALVPWSLYSLLILAGHAQTAESFVSSLRGQQLLLCRLGDRAETKLELGKLRDIVGDCDVAVSVRETSSKSGKLRLTLTRIGTPQLGGSFVGWCLANPEEIKIEIRGLERNGSSDLVPPLIRSILKTPDEYLRAKGVMEPSSRSSPSGAEAARIGTWLVPQVLLRVHGVFTRASRAGNVSGDVDIAATVGTDGILHDARLVRDLRGGLGESALRVLSMWRFAPGYQNGSPFAFPTTITMHFIRLEP